MVPFSFSSGMDASMWERLEDASSSSTFETARLGGAGLLGNGSDLLKQGWK